MNYPIYCDGFKCVWLEQKQNLFEITEKRDKVASKEPIMDSAMDLREPASVMIRDAVPTDIAQMKELIFTHGPNPWNYLPTEGVTSHLEGITEGKTLGLLAFSGQELVGMVTFTEQNPFMRYEPEGASSTESGYIAEAVVSKSFAGRGLGSKLLSEACAKLCARGKRRIYIDRHEENVASAGMMRKAGFLEIDTYEDLDKRFSGSKRSTVSRYTVREG